MNEKIEKMLAGFHYLTINKMHNKELSGYTGWDDSSIISDEELCLKMSKNILDQDWVDVSNLAAILWYRQNCGE